MRLTSEDRWNAAYDDLQADYAEGRITKAEFERELRDMRREQADEEREFGTGGGEW